MKATMKIFLPLIAAALLFYSFDTNPENHTPMDNYQITLAFVTYSGYSNNLYIDNLTVGKRDTLDVTVLSINNIPKDTSYNNDSSQSILISPRVSIANLGSQAFGPFVVKMQTSAGYYDTIAVTGMTPGSVNEISFKPATLSVGSPNNIVVYISNTMPDNKNTNDTLYQTSIIFPGAKRKILLEEWTSTTCNSCAVNNPSLDAYVNSKIDSTVAIKYHVGFPLPGNDSMYFSDSAEVNQRLDYYGVSAVPEVIIDGTTIADQPYSGANLDNPFTLRKLAGTPVTINVIDTRIAGDSISSDITLNVIAPIKYGNYRMRVNAIERSKTYTTPPGSNGETVFYDIFRHSYPNMNGVSIPLTPGIYFFNYKYKKEAGWVDSMMYTAVYIQNEDTKEVLNAGKGRNVVLDRTAKNIFSFNTTNNFSNIPSGRNVCLSDRPRSYGKRVSVYNPESSLVLSSFSYELFEGSFPPSGWRLNNPNGDITFAPVSGPNGILFGGGKSIFMNFYDNSEIGRRDTLITKTFYGVNPTDSLSFDYAYAQYQTQVDSLIVIGSIDGGITWPYRLFAKGGSSLATSTTTTGYFVPSSPSQWRTFTLSLNGIVGIRNISTEIPSGYELKQNYPNPFNPTTNISFSIPKASIVKISIYDLTGKKIDEVIKENLQTGTYNYTWSGSNLSSGVYFYTIEAGEFKASKKMILLK